MQLATVLLLGIHIHVKLCELCMIDIMCVSGS